VLEQTHEPVVVCRPGGEIVFWNRGAERLYGYTREEALGRVVHELLATQAQVDMNKVDTEIAREGAWNGELVQRTKEGKTIVVESTVTRFQEPDQWLSIETSRDITRRKELEEDLRNRVRELAAADEQKNEFVAMLAHELRNPLAPIRNALALIKLRETGADAELAKVHDMLERQVAKMSRIVSDLLEAAKVTRSELQLRSEAVNLHLVLERSAELLGHAIKARRQELKLKLGSAPMMVMADATRLEQVFGNLLENAVKFTPEGGSIEVSAEVERGNSEPAGFAVVRVKDDGAGITESVLPHIFDLFVQGKQSLDRGNGGLGIGLSLVRSLVERHGGTVTAHSLGAGHGAEFVVRLPLMRAESD